MNATRGRLRSGLATGEPRGAPPRGASPLAPAPSPLPDSSSRLPARLLLPTPSPRYGVSKAALCLYARALNRKLAGAGVRGAASVADPGVAATGINYQHELVRSLGLNRRGVKSTRAYHDGYALHAADAALPLVHAALAGEPNEFWLGEQIGPRASSMDSAAHRAGHLLWPPLRPNDPFNWPMAAVERLWSRVEKLASIEPWPTGAEPVGAATPTGGGAKKKEEL